MPNNNFKFSLSEWETCLKVLEQLKDSPLDNPDNQRFSGLVSKIYKNARKSLKKGSYTQKRSEDLAKIKNSKIAKNALDNTSDFGSKERRESSNFSKLNIPRNCYSCNQSYDLLHSFYHRLCPDCATLNYEKRFQKVDLKNRNIILTGGRVKVGYATALKILRGGGNLLLTTRFPALALESFTKEKDFSQWQDKLEVYGLDLRNLKAVEQFIDYYKSKYSSLDILINNAAQTIKYTNEYYTPLIQEETRLETKFLDNQSFNANATPVIDQVKALSGGVVEPYYDINRFGQPVDKRNKNSWNSTLEEISNTELLEVNLINHIAPYFLIKGLTSLLKNSKHPSRFIINVTSSEGQFSYENKTIFHPHTNMTKAALNMLTRTSGKEYAKKGIFMNAIDVGWVSTGAQEELRKKQFESGYIPPLDSVDAAARILHPIFDELNNRNTFIGKLIKNYQIENW